MALQHRLERAACRYASEYSNGNMNDADVTGSWSSGAANMSAEQDTTAHRDGLSDISGSAAVDMQHEICNVNFHLTELDHVTQ
jgi:hypothetical protein